MSNTSELLKNIQLPRFFRVKQVFSGDSIPREDLLTVLDEQLFQFKEKIRPGMKIAITAGSRGLASYATILRGIIDFCKEQKASPFIVPSMGSHGGANADLQVQLLEEYGITEESMGCPIFSSMEVVKIGLTSDDVPVHVDRIASEADGIIVFNRIKPHTCFRGEYQSGIYKMCAIGLANQVGADICHSQGYGLMGHNVYEIGDIVINNSNILFAVATIENAFDKVSKIEVIDPQEIKVREPILLEEANRIMPRIFLDECDVLVVDEIGKNFSGDGMDPNVTGRFGTEFATGGIKSQSVCVLDLSPETHGNGIGVGTADATTKRCVDKLVLDEMYPNAITSIATDAIKIPYTLNSDRETIQLSVKLCNGTSDNIRIIRIPNTSFLQHILLSESYYNEVKNRSDLIIESEPEYLPFDENGNLTDLEPRVRS